MKIKYTLLLVFCAFLIQSCKKDGVTASTTTTAPISPFQAYLDGTLWAPSDTLSAVVTYNPTTKTRVLTCSATHAQKQVTMAITNTNSPAGVNFPIGTYTSNATFNYSTLQNVGGKYVYTPFGTTKDGSQQIIIASIDTVKKTLTGTFNFISTNTVYDNNGNFVSISIAQIATGQLTSLPYTYKTVTN
ncbi:DUF6252 family protein [Mucilaginibacter jinjuensis]|uniref:YD repeat-containing protein n=1 Tax=Mucilaginibacter jinjuensis TaxID=1176721 RepID=A0ABY7T1K1_9SPHI|nr:DUF6252 family protein [Mucilaginibacter jinjuensis]WCT10211.1 hypothetical protein PQO05_15860 [Mucilaginibacter jinjuensis]